MPETIIKQATERMEKTIGSLRKELSSLRAGRAHPSLLERIQVDYYGSPTPIGQVGTITTPDPRTLIIQPWDKSIITDIEKAINKSDLGLNPANDGIVIRISIPPLTEERRSDLVKMTKKYGEEAKIAIRNIRRDANIDIKKLEKNGVSEDESHRYQEEIQKFTDRYTSEVDKVLIAKEAEIMEV